MPRTRYRSGALLAALAAWLPASALVPALPSYITNVIPVPANAASVVPTAINNQGQVTGSLVFANQPAHAFLYGPGGAMTDLGTLNYPGSTTQGAAAGQALNDAGVVVGTYADPVAQSWSFGFLYQNGTMTALAGASGYTNCTATGVNDMVTIVGGCATLDGSFAALYQGGVPQPLGPSGGSASGVNTYGQVAASGTASGFLYLNGAVTNIPALATIAAPAPPATPTALNNAGQTVGWESDNGNFAAFLYSYSTGTTQALAAVPESSVQPVIAINNAGQVVGSTTEVSSGAVVPYFVANGTMTDINVLISADDPNRTFVTITNAYAINDAGWILATGFDSRTQASGAYVLIPTAALSTSVAVAAPAAAVTGTPFTVAWTDQSATSCTATGGSGNDGWMGAVATSGGQQLVTESAAGAYTFTVDCHGRSGGAVSASAKVVVATSVVPGLSGSGGGGSLDAGTLALMLLALAALRGMRAAGADAQRGVIALG
jgi:probable HAF family extracellular repeat protein